MNKLTVSILILLFWFKISTGSNFERNSRIAQWAMANGHRLIVTKSGEQFLITKFGKVIYLGKSKRTRKVNAFDGNDRQRYLTRGKNSTLEGPIISWVLHISTLSVM